MQEGKGRTTFPKARIVSEGFFRTPQGDYVQTVFVDLSGQLQGNAVCLAKASEPQFDLATTSSIRLSRPGVFRKTGEVLVRDEQEGQAQTSTSETIEGTTDESDQLHERVKAINVALQLGQTKMSLNAKKKKERTSTASSAVTFGRDWLIYCNSINPAEEEKEWRRTFPEGYTNIAHIHRPTQFAQGLGLGVCEHIGVNGKPEPVRGAFFGFRTVEMHRKVQLVLHGPVLYVDDPHRCISEAEAGWESLCAMILVKSREYAAQKEYRFAMLSVKPEVGDVFDLPVSGVLRDCLLPVTYPENTSVPDSAVVSIDDSPDPKVKVSKSGYTYRRRIRRTEREWSNWGRGGEETDRSGEEVIEETVKSPDKIPEPFPAQEERQPDVIVIQQLGGRYQWIHEAYRQEEIENWRIKTIRENALERDGSVGRVRPQALSVPAGVRYEALEEHPVDPRLVLDLCLNPSVPKPPMTYEGLARCNWSEIGQALACGRSLGMAVDLLKDVEQDRAAASAWYAFRFILDLVSLFGPVVKSVCVIRECVAVVDLERAPFLGAVAWATFSGTGTYTLYINDGNVENLWFAGQLSRAGSICPGTYIDKLQEYGWNRKG